ncbi:MAG: hypothetical protein MHPSP_001628 [Paramarteilia canceri]
MKIVNEKESSSKIRVYLKVSDLEIGKSVSINSSEYKVVGADWYTLKFIDDNPELYNKKSKKSLSFSELMKMSPNLAGSAFERDCELFIGFREIFKTQTGVESQNNEKLLLNSLSIKKNEDNLEKLANLESTFKKKDISKNGHSTGRLDYQSILQSVLGLKLELNIEAFKKYVEL